MFNITCPQGQQNIPINRLKEYVFIFVYIQFKMFLTFSNIISNYRKPACSFEMHANKKKHIQM